MHFGRPWLNPGRKLRTHPEFQNLHPRVFFSQICILARNSSLHISLFCWLCGTHLQIDSTDWGQSKSDGHEVVRHSSPFICSDGLLYRAALILTGPRTGLHCFGSGQGIRYCSVFLARLAQCALYVQSAGLSLRGGQWKKKRGDTGKSNFGSFISLGQCPEFSQ